MPPDTEDTAEFAAYAYTHTEPMYAETDADGYADRRDTERDGAPMGPDRAILRVHAATFVGSTDAYYFLKLRNESISRPLVIRRIWFALGRVNVDVENPDRPLPAVIGPGDLFETWIPFEDLPATTNVWAHARAELGDGTIVESSRNEDVARSGVVGGAGSPLDRLAESVADLNHADGKLIRKKWDVFISYASQDRDALVRPLATALRSIGLSVWYDEFELSIGDSLRRGIDRGIAMSAFGVVVLSPAFFAKHWTQHELDGLVTRSVRGKQILLPLWHGVGVEEVMAYSPSLADKVALSTTTNTVDALAEAIAGVVRRATTTPPTT